MPVDAISLRKIADLAAIYIEEKELEKFAKDMELIIGYMEQISLIDTGDTEPMSHIVPVTNVLRNDEVTNACRRDELLKPADVTKEGYHAVPNVVDLS